MVREGDDTSVFEAALRASGLDDFSCEKTNTCIGQRFRLDAEHSELSCSMGKSFFEKKVGFHYLAERIFADIFFFETIEIFFLPVKFFQKSRNDIF